MATTYTYSISGDTPNGRVAPDSLEQEINDSSISSGVLEVISAGSATADTLDIRFDVALSVPDKGVLDGLVSTHLGGFIPPEGETAGFAFAAIDKDLTTPPGSPSTGDTYLIPSGATGVWAGRTSQITKWDGAEWTYRYPISGVAAWLNDEKRLYVYESASNRWVAAAAQYNTAATNPTVNDDDTLGYMIGARWVNTATNQEYALIDNTTGAAVWRNLSLPTYSRIVTVGAAGADVDFQSIKTAVDYVVAQGASNATPWIVRVAPGSYTETNPIAVPAGVTVMSFSAVRVATVKVTPVTATDHLFTMTGGALVGLDMSGVTDAARALVNMATPGQASVLRYCAVSGCSTGLLISGGAACVTTGFTAVVASPGVAITVAAIKVTGSGSLLLAEATSMQVPAAILPAYGVNPIQRGLWVESSGEVVQTGGAYIIAPKDTTQVSVQADSGADLTLTGIEFQDSETALQVLAGGSDTTVHVTGCSFHSNTTNFDVLSSTAKVFVNAAVDSEKRSIVAGAVFSGFLQEESAEHTEFFGGVVYEFPTGKDTDFALFFHDQQSSGLVSGGVVTDAGGLTIDVAAGTGWIQRNGANDDAFNVSWDAAAGLSLTATATNYVFYNGNTDALVVSTSPPGDESIGLAAVVTSGSGIRYNHIYTNRVDAPDFRLHEYLVNTRRVFHKSGLAPSTGTTVRNIDIGSGAYYRALTTVSFAGAADATFSSFYGTDAATEIASQTLVNITQYDNAGTLTAMTAGYFRSDTLILTSDGRINVLFGTVEYSTAAGAVEEATLPAVPTFMEQSGFRIARLIVEEANGIVDIVDERVPTTGGGGGGGITVHSLLSGLGADDHTQYLLVDGSRAMSGNLDMGGNSITNVNLVDGVDVSAHGSRHNPGGIDAIATAAPSGTGVQVGGTAAEGSAASLARSDHAHTVTAAAPVAITDSTNAEGAASTFVRSDHQHAHGDRGGGTLHAAATPSVAGFISAADKTKLDGIATGATNTPLTNTVPVNVTKAAAVVGVSTEAARQDHKHDASTAAAVAATAGQANSEGAGTTLARSSHTHAHAVGTPVELTDSTNGAGAATTFNRSDHTHAHGNRGGGSLHAVVTTSVNGFMSAADKTKLDGLVGTGDAARYSTVFASGQADTTSGSFVDGLGGSTVQPPVNGTYMILFNGNASGSTGNTETEFGISLNSTTSIILDSSRRAQGNGGDRIPASTHTVVTSLVTTDVIRVLFRKSGGSGTSSILDRRVTLIRVVS